MTATGYTQLYVGTFLFALANGVVEAVTNPVTATLYPDTKTKHLNILHAGWAGGLVLGGILALALGGLEWRWKIGLFLLPALVYGAMMLGCRFPVQERVAAGVSYGDMLREFGWAGCGIVSYFVARAFDEVALGVFNTALSPVLLWAITLVPTIGFAWKVRSFGRPVFVILLLVMILLATTELGTDSWVTALMTPGLAGISTHAGAWLLIYTSAVMLAQLAGPEVSKFGLSYRPLDKQKIAALPPAERTQVEAIRNANNQATLPKMAILPAIMFVCYFGLLLFHRSRGGYRAVPLAAASPAASSP